MKLNFRRYLLQLKHAFTITRGTHTEIPVIFVELQHDGIVGIGEASPSLRYGETPETVEAFLGQVNLDSFENPFIIDAILEYIRNLAPGNTAAKTAIDIALHDWIGKKLGIPLCQFLGLEGTKTPYSSYTIGIDTPEKMMQKVEEAAEYPILKVKLGLDNDKEIMTAIRGITRKTLRVDANEGWKTRELALERIQWLAELGVEFVEQPMPASQIDDIAWLRERSPLPLIADESVVQLEDIPHLAHAFDGVNIKLMKCSGIREALRMINAARASRLKVMMGCMVESSVGISAAAQLSPLLDFADLDGAELISNDPYEGATIEKGRLKLPDRPGIGVIKR
jgi:L-alanine-DL-glutamate epimerase-like enolase superfamily enzyme